MNEPDIVARIDAVVAQRAMLQHPFYRAWSAGELPIDTLRTYAAQYYHHVEAFPMAVSAIHSTWPEPRGRRMLAENLAEEEGIGEGKDDHATLWRRFALGLGVQASELEAAELHSETQALIAAFASLSRRNYAAGLGALYAYESQLPEVARAKIEGLIRFYGIEDEATLRFFRVHERADIEHAKVCRDLLRELPSWRQLEAEKGATALADALWAFLSGILGCRRFDPRLREGGRPCTSPNSAQSVEFRSTPP
ncbi:MAG TPA: CADD family putative folate metabolism protein [Terricaulis sp.]|nr:CADD family putative folate metabolism protein [Terricaulis sp.]HRP11547.1 CADD family putative folate metabolism protein [Terricaulis sp.]